jgi:hypothetical protein
MRYAPLHLLCAPVLTRKPSFSEEMFTASSFHSASNATSSCPTCFFTCMAVVLLCKMHAFSSTTCPRFGTNSRGTS